MQLVYLVCLYGSNLQVVRSVSSSILYILLGKDNAGVEIHFEGLYVLVESSICLCCIIGRWRRACVVYC